MLLKSLSNKSDYIGIVSATICLIHCIAMPIFFGVFMHSHGGHDHSHHEGFKVDYIFLLIGLVAIIFSTKHTDNKWIRAFLWISYLILVTSVIFEGHSAFFGVVALHRIRRADRCPCGQFEALASAFCRTSFVVNDY